MSSSGVVLVTGGTGFLGQHIIKLLQEKADWVSEIIVFDIREYNNILAYTGTKPVTSILGSITDPTVVSQALQGVGAVIHAASLVSVGILPDVEGMKAVNVQGTKNIIAACRENNVPHLVYTSSADIMTTGENIVNGDEDLPYVAEEKILREYARTKQTAEQLVRHANGTPLKCGNGQKLKTVGLRCQSMYGEGDEHFITHILKIAKGFAGWLPRFGSERGLTQVAYVGNEAWAHVLALKALREERPADGLAFFIPDDTPVQNIFDTLDTFIKVKGFKMVPFGVPYFLVYMGLFVLEMLLWIVSPIKRINCITDRCSLIFTDVKITFSRSKAESLLGFKPLFSTSEAMRRSLEYYEKVNL